MVWYPVITEVEELLAKNYGSSNVKVHTEYHIRVLFGEAHHDVWVNGAREVKLRIYGKREKSKRIDSPRQLIDQINSYEKVSSDLFRAREAVQLADLIADARNFLPVETQKAIFVDAGWKDGLAVIAAVRVSRTDDGFRVRAESYPYRCNNSYEAEVEACTLGSTMGKEDTMIYCDCKSLEGTDRFPWGKRVTWLRREQNKVADKVGNMRKRRKKK